MRKRIIALVMVLAAGLSCNVYGAQAAKKSAVQTKTKSTAYNYNWDYNDFTEQFVFGSPNGDKAYIADGKIVLFKSSGKQTKALKYSLSDKPKAYFTQGNYHYFLTGKTERNKLVYTLNKFDEFGHVKTEDVKVDMYSDFTYKGAFSDIPVRYSKDDGSVVFEICPDASDNRKAYNEKDGYLRRSPIVYIAFDFLSMTGVQDSKELTKTSLKMNMYNGRYDSTPYAVNFYDFVLGGNKQAPKLFFNGTQLDDRGIVRINEPQYYGSNSMFRDIYNTKKDGLFIVTAPTSGNGRPLAFNEANLAVQAEESGSLLVGDIMNYGDSVIITGKDGKEFKNVFTAYYNPVTKTNKKTYLTDYKKADKVRVSTPYAFNYEDTGIVLWYETAADNTTLIKFTKLKKSGSPEGKILEINTKGIIPAKPLFNENYLYYITQNQDGAYTANEYKYK